MKIVVNGNEVDSKENRMKIRYLEHSLILIEFTATHSEF